MELGAWVLKRLRQDPPPLPLKKDNGEKNERLKQIRCS